MNNELHRTIRIGLVLSAFVLAVASCTFMVATLAGESTARTRSDNETLKAMVQAGMQPTEAKCVMYGGCGKTR